MDNSTSNITKYTQKRKNFKKNLLNFDKTAGKFITSKIDKSEESELCGIIYVRVSSDIQMNKGHGIETQEQICQEWAKRNGVKVIGVYKDEAISGANLNRKGLNNAIDTLKTQNKNYTKIKYFICTEASRISRSDNLIDTLFIDKEISSTGSEIIYVLQPVDTSTDEGMLIKQIQYVYGSYERKKIAKRSRNAIRGRLLMGYRSFPVPPVGYEFVKEKTGSKTNCIVKIKEPEGSIIKEALELFANGVLIGKADLVNFLKERELKTNSPKRSGIYHITLADKLLDPVKLFFYAGYIIYPSREINELIEAKHDSITSLEVVYKIFDRLKSKTVSNIKKTINSDDFPLKGVLYCEHCGNKMTGRYSKNKLGNKYPYYGCTSKKCGSRINFNANKLNTEFGEFMKKLTPKADYKECIKIMINDIRDQQQHVFDKSNKKSYERIKEINKEIKEIEESLLKLSNPSIIKKFEEKRGFLEEEKNQINENLLKEKSGEGNIKDLLEKTINIICHPISIWELGNVELKQLLIGVLLNGKIFYKKNSGYRTPETSVLYNMLEGLSTEDTQIWVRRDSNPGPIA